MRRYLSAILLLIILLTAGVVSGQSARDAGDSLDGISYLPLVAVSDAYLSGVVLDASGPVAGAVVRVPATIKATLSDENGRFTLRGLLGSGPVRVTAWANDYYIGGGEAHTLGSADIVIMLTPLPVGDNEGYAWVSAHAQAGEEGNCQNCHADESGLLPYDEWLQDAHARSATNGRFLNMYLGTDSLGNQSPPTEVTCTPDYGCFPLPPDPNKAYYGPGYKLDFPGSAGNCAACHTPAAAVNNPLGVDPSTVSGVGTEGVACDFCHKIEEVKLDQETGLPPAHKPGVMSYELRRPPEGHQFFAGPFDDVAPGEDTYSPLQKESAYCAPCHSAVFWDTQIYNSYGEWLASPYSDPADGQSCQDCHMPARGINHFARLDQGGLVRNPQAIRSHLMPGAANEALLQSAVSMVVKAQRIDDKVLVTVTITNDQTGHHVPTDSPLRHLLLLVQATDNEGAPMVQVSGPTIPAWGGVGDPGAGYYAGLPGTGYAKILKELWTEVSPTGAYWNHTAVVSDNRIPALGSDKSRYVFEGASGGEVNIYVRLLFRRAFITLADQKRWDVDDLLMEEAALHIPWP
jgi:mono/diheme cytochrome c family protein